MEFSNKLTRENNFIRTLYASVEKMNNVAELSAICVYDKNGIICKHDFGYFDNDYELEFNGTVVRKLKENFTGKENYVIKAGRDDIWGGTRYVMYIHKDNVNLEYLGMDKMYSCVYDVYMVNGKAKIKILLKNLEVEFNRYVCLLEKEIKKIKIYNLPLAENDMKQICENLMKYNTLVIQEKEKIKNYVPTEEDRKGANE